jgi:hypothetical protein
MSTPLARTSRMTDERPVFTLLRVAAGLCFIGHGAFGIIGKQAWLPYFAIAFRSRSPGRSCPS